MYIVHVHVCDKGQNCLSCTTNIHCTCMCTHCTLIIHVLCRTDGILAALVRQGVANDNQDKKWYVFDGPVDAIWIESMNTVLDDNKKLCLSSGEIIKLTEVMTMMFEVQDLAVASPATVSRCGMVYLEPSILGLKPFVRCWLKTIPKAVAVHKEKLEDLFDMFLEVSIRDYYCM